MKINDVAILRNIIGDQTDDEHTDILHRKIPSFKMKQLNLKKLPKRDIYGRNLTAEDEDVIKAAGGKPSLMPYTTSDPDKKDEAFQQKVKDFEKQKALDKIAAYNNPMTKRTTELKQQADLLQAEAVARLLAPKKQEPLSKKVFLSKDKEHGRYINVPTTAGFYKGFERFSKNVATPMTRNLSYSAGGAIVGEFGDEISGRKLQKSIKAKQMYVAYLTTKYSKKGYRISGEADLYGVVSPGEERKLYELNELINRDQQLASSKGFMSGAGGSAVLRRTRSQSQSLTVPRVSKLTEMGTPKGEYGSFGPEALSRLGVTQSLSRGLKPEDKWGVIFGGSSGTSVDRIAGLIGKAPDPGTKTLKMGKYINPFDIGKSKNSMEDYKNKVRRLL